VNLKSSLLVALGTLSVFSALIIGDAASSATHDDRPMRIARRMGNVQMATARTNPFVALAAPKNTATQILDLQQRPSVPGPHAPSDRATTPAIAPAAQESVVLCNTWALDKRDKSSDRTPVAVFAIGTQTIVAAPGDDIGGYILASVELDGVKFASGERLSIADCVKDAASNGVEPASAPNSSQFPPTFNATEPGLSNNTIVPNISGTATVSNPLNTTTINSNYGSGPSPQSVNDPSSYAGSVYGSAPPTSAPKQQLDPRYQRPFPQPTAH